MLESHSIGLEFNTIHFVMSNRFHTNQPGPQGRDPLFSVNKTVFRNRAAAGEEKVTKRGPIGTVTGIARRFYGFACGPW